MTILRGESKYVPSYRDPTALPQKFPQGKLLVILIKCVKTNQSVLKI